MYRFLAIGVLGLVGCANFCDTFFKARGVCRTQSAVQPVVVSAPMVTCASVTCAGVYDCASPYLSSQVLSSPVVDPTYVPVQPAMPVQPVVPVPQPPINSGVPTTEAEGVILGEPIAEVQPVSGQVHPLARPFQWMHRRGANRE